MADEKPQPPPDGFVPGPPPKPVELPGEHIILNPQQLTYRNFSALSQKCSPILDEFAYNVGTQANPEPVHDFMFEADVEPLGGCGSVTFALNDGRDWVELEIPVNQSGRIASRRLDGQAKADLFEEGPERQLFGGRGYHIEMAFIDRRLSVAIYGEELFRAVDLPAARERGSVDRPFRLKAQGIEIKVNHVRLYRDLHFSRLGQNAQVGQSVRLGVDQMFVLGDNSSNSEDSRMWPEQGKVSLANVVGRPFLVHWPSRTARRPGSARTWQLPECERVWWLR